MPPGVWSMHIRMRDGLEVAAPVSMLGAKKRDPNKPLQTLTEHGGSARASAFAASRPIPDGGQRGVRFNTRIGQSKHCRL